MTGLNKSLPGDYFWTTSCDAEVVDDIGNSWNLKI